MPSHSRRTPRQTNKARGVGWQHTHSNARDCSGAT